MIQIDSSNMNTADFSISNQVSFLRARDPSILACNRDRAAAAAEVRRNLSFQPNEVQEDKLPVYLRIKPTTLDGNDYEIQDNKKLICTVPESSNSGRNNKNVRKTYSFTHIFSGNTTQSDMFNALVKPKIIDFINGQTFSIFTYGASGSGKTFTVTGTDEDPGLIPRSLEYLFKTLPQLADNALVKPLHNGEIITLDNISSHNEQLVCRRLINSSTVDRSAHSRTYKKMQQRLSSEPIGITEADRNVKISIWVSFAEIYNEYIYDLLQSDCARGQSRPKLRLGTWHGTHYIKNLRSIQVSSGLEAYQVLQFGKDNLNCAATNVNSNSSRSHAIFTIKLVQVSSADNKVHITNLNFCDLAGSERTKLTKNTGERLKESNNINSSLLVLGRCMSAVRTSQKKCENQTIVPFRESKLTQLFQKALSGGEPLTMIVNVNPSRKMFDETVHVLNFSAIAKEIALDAEVVKPKMLNRFTQLLDNYNVSETSNENMELRNMVGVLQDELERKIIENEENRTHLINGYKKLMKDHEQISAMQLKLAEKKVEERYIIKMDQMRKQYQRENQVILINSESDSDDEEKDNLRDIIKQQQADIQEMQEKVLEVDNLKNRLKGQNAKISELEHTLNDAILSYRDLQNSCVDHNNELVQLRERCADLENINGVLTRELANRSEEEEAYMADTMSTNPDEGGDFA